MGFEADAYAFTNPRLVLIQACDLGMGYEAPHRTYVMHLAQAIPDTAVPSLCPTKQSRSSRNYV